jgi:RHS repeat-associated protein
VADKPQTGPDFTKGQDTRFRVEAPQLALPKGGGAIRGIGEKFAANPVTGTGSLSLSVYTSPGRSGFGPQLSLSYDSGASNGPFGLGWSLGLPALTRKTDKGLPQYADAEESDTFILSGAEDLVPVLKLDNGSWVRVVSPRTVFGAQYEVHAYRPRVEGLFARIERWINVSNRKDNFWRSIDRNNITSWYGRTPWHGNAPTSGIVDPADPSHVFSWRICETYDDKGNVAFYQYKQEDSAGLDLSQANERNRSSLSRSANSYLKRVLYGNRAPYLQDLHKDQPAAHPSDWCFELVFDYGEHDPNVPVPQETGTWTARPDAFSTYRPTFEVRTYRLCRRVLMFHHFPGDPAVGLNCLVRSTDLLHAAPGPDPTKPFYSTLLSVQQTAYRRDGSGGYLSKALPPLQFKYTEASINEAVQEIDPESMANLPSGLDGAGYRWVDLDGEGLPGILTEQGGAWFYKPNLSPQNQQTTDGVTATRAQFGDSVLVAPQPSLAALGGGRQQLLDLSGNGHLDLAQFDAPTPGFFERTDDDSWEQFASFHQLPVLDWKDPNLKLIDLTGDGHADLLISEDNAFLWHDSLATAGFGRGQRVPQEFDEEKGPKLVFADSAETIFLADLSGDGLTDLVRIRNGEVCYWPNLGYGRFGAKVTMDGAPWFDTQDLYDGRRIHLADIDGSGTADIIYFANGSVHLYFNQSGNGWGERKTLQHFPRVESSSSAAVVDLLGNGTACLVWSSPLPGNTRQPMRYIDLMGGQKPHLLVSSVNNLGAETRVDYAPSTKFYVADKLAGTPWLTRIPFPVHVVERVETYDYVSRNRFVTRYSYHHGFYDGVEREFRGFGRVDQLDTEEFGALSDSSAFPEATNIDAASNVPPVLTKTWFHTGVFLGGDKISRHLEDEYYREGDPSGAIPGLSQEQLEAMLIPDTVLPTTVLLPNATRMAYSLTGEETREACRALRGSILRHEVYALDGTDESDRPYGVSERNYTLEVYQPQGPNKYAVFLAHARESIDFHYERKLFKVKDNTLVAKDTPGALDAADPRVTHAFTLSVDNYANILQSAAIGYGRRYIDPDLATLDGADQAKQSNSLCAYNEASFTNVVISDDDYRTPLPAEASAFELLQVKPDSAQQQLTNLFRFAELARKIQAAADGAHDIAFEDLNPAGLNPGQPYRRLLKRERTLYRPDDMGQSAGDADALLPFGVLQRLALPGSGYKLAFTSELISKIYARAATPLLPDPPAVLESVGPDGGGYVDLDQDGRHWWAPSARVYYLPAPASAQDELAQAVQHFFLPRRFKDPFGNSASVDYDEPNDLLAVKATDPASNTVTSLSDYRVLHPSLVTDPNGNQVAASFDVLGMVVATAVMGKPGENKGDKLDNLKTDLTQTDLDNFHDAPDPHALAADLLQGASTRIIYDLDRFRLSQNAHPDDMSQWEAPYAATLVRETHVNDRLPPQGLKIQISFSYSDGFGREIQKKIQAESGPVPTRDASGKIIGGPDGLPVMTAGDVSPRWAGSGWTIFNNKGKPVRQYEPFFTDIHRFEFDVRIGVSAVLLYDPVERVVATLHPNRTYEKVVFDPWHQHTYDVNDTVLQTDPTSDPDIKDFFQRLPLDDYSPSWFALRTDPAFAAEAARRWPDPATRTHEAEAAAKAAAHANTPATAYFDTLGRAFLTIADNAADGKYATRVEPDIEGNQRSVTDALGRTVMVYDYDMLGNRVHESSMEAGERWMLKNVMGKPIRAWDSRGHNFRTEYADALRRPTGLFVQGTDANSDPRTVGTSEVLFEKTIYGEEQPDDIKLNLRTRVFQHSDAAGVVTSKDRNPETGDDEAYDFKGNLLRATRQLVADYKGIPDWSGAPPMEPKIFSSSTQYDALNRPIAATTPDGSVVHPMYNDANFLEILRVNVRGAVTATAFVTNINYDAKGRRTLIQYGNSTQTTYDYDPETLRLVRLISKRVDFPGDQQTVQDLAYTYDPAGNITHIQDNADIQNVVFFRNQRVEPSNDYTYDAIYRLISASGREQLGLDGGGNRRPPTASSYNDVPRIALTPMPGDGNAVGLYQEQYQYDPLGNFLEFVHKGPNQADPGWTRTYIYNQASQLEPGKFSNRLGRTEVSGNQPLIESYTYDVHGNMTSMPQLQAMQWNFKDELLMTRRQAVNATDDDGVQHQGERTFYVYDTTGQRARKVTESAAGIKRKERLYLGGLEVYREYDAGGAVSLERETLHVMDDKHRVSLVETRTQGNDGSPAQLIRYQLSNHLGSASLELDDQAQIISYEEYCPYGNTSYQSGRSAVEVNLKRYRYTGMERDEESGLNYHTARYYATWLGRWVSTDRIGIDDGTNLYQMEESNPIRYIDLQGTENTDASLSDIKMPTRSGGKEYNVDKYIKDKQAGLSRLANKIKGLGQKGGVTVEVALVNTKNNQQILVAGINTGKEGGFNQKQLKFMEKAGINVAPQTVTAYGKGGPHAEENIVVFVQEKGARAERWSKGVVGRAGSYNCAGCQWSMRQVGGEVEQPYSKLQPIDKLSAASGGKPASRRGGAGGGSIRGGGTAPSGISSTNPYTTQLDLPDAQLDLDSPHAPSRTSWHLGPTGRLTDDDDSETARALERQAAAMKATGAEMVGNLATGNLQGVVQKGANTLAQAAPIVMTSPHMLGAAGGLRANDAGQEARRVWARQRELEENVARLRSGIQIGIALVYLSTGVPAAAFRSR